MKGPLFHLGHAVLDRALSDATMTITAKMLKYQPNLRRAQEQARAFLMQTEGESSLLFWCLAARVHVQKVIAKAQELSASGWQMDTNRVWMQPQTKDADEVSPDVESYY